MLQFLRKNQSYFFIVITIVIIASFSFFGTYNSLPNADIRDQIVFTAVDGTKVKRSDLDEFVTFLNTDSEDKLLFGGAWGPNFLNNGVIKRDILETGLAEALVAAYPDAVRPDLVTRLEKEKRFTAYRHPQAPFISLENSWGMFAPDLKKSYTALRQSTDPADPQSFANRVTLYLAAQKFPSSLIRRVLQYQEQQYSLNPDPNLHRVDLSMFGYNTLEDWFGQRFTRLVSEFIINASKIAIQKGYKVTKEEALADLIRNAEISFQQNIKSPQLGVTNSKEYFNEQLRIMGMDQTTAVKIWTQVLLTERLFQDVGNAVFVDALAFKEIGKYANESLSGNLYHLPKALHLTNFNDLQKFEAYLSAISKHSQTDKDLLSLPTSTLSPEEIAKKYPELVQKQYLLEIAETSKKNLENKISFKDLWNWEVEDNNWKKIVAKFPELDSKASNTRTERFELLDNLNDKVREQADSFSRSAIVDEHPEWINDALANAETNKLVLGITAKGGHSYFVGLKDRAELIQLLDKASITGKNSTKESSAADEKLLKFTSNGDMYYRIKVIDRSPEKEVLTFAEASQKDLLGDILNRQLENYYIQTRTTNAEAYQNADKSWKDYAKIKNEVAKLYFEKLIKEIESDYVASGHNKPEQFNADKAASLRLYHHVRTITQKIKSDPQSQNQYVLGESKEEDPNKLPASMPLSDQWKLENDDYETTRATANQPGVDTNEWFALKEGSWTKVYAPHNGDIFSFHIIKKGINQDEEGVLAKATNIHSIISHEAQRNYMATVIDELKAKNAISLDYLNTSYEEN